MSDNQTDQIKQLQEELAAAKKELARARDFHKAFTWNSLAEFTWDYTTGIVEEEVYVQTPHGRYGVAQMSGVTLPAPIDELVGAFADKYVHADWANWYKTNFSVKFVRANYEEIGPYNLAFERKLISEDFGALYARFQALVTEDPETGHLMAPFVMSDCTNRYRLVAPLEYHDMDTARVALLAALKQVFLVVAHVDLKNDTPNVLSATDSVSTYMLEKKPVTVEDMRGLLMGMLVEEDRPRYLEFTELSSLPERLSREMMLAEEFGTVTGLRVRASIIPVDTNYGLKEQANARYYDERFTDYNNNNNNNNKDLFNDFIFTVADVTEERLREQQLEEARHDAQAANDAKTKFLFNMSHDIRTPMNAIIGYTGLMEKHIDDKGRLEDYLGKIRSSGDLLLELINNVLEMARIESGAMALDEAVWDSYEMNNSIFDVLDEQMKAKNIRFDRSIDIQNQYVYCDSLKLREIFMNVLSNAYKYTLSGGSVHMDLKELPSDREGYALYKTTITDTGIGMSEEYLPHIFEEFSRETSSTESGVQGTGLGLPIVKRLVDLMGGSIAVESKLGEGTTFTILLYHRISSKDALEVPDVANHDSMNFRGKRILLAEDNELNAEIATEILEETGASVERAADGIEAVDMLAKAKAGYYNLILMDIQMPNLDGYGATKRIRAFEDVGKAEIPIVAMTANAFEEDKRDALDAGMDGHLAKPIDMNKLMETLGTYLV